MAFDPDEYLNEKGSPSTATTEFDPDAYLSEPDSEQEPEFDPDAYLAEPPPVGTSLFEEITQIPQAIKQSIGQPLEAMGETAEVLGAPDLGATLRGAIEEPKEYVPAAQRFMQPQEGEFQIGGFAPQFLPRAIVEQAGQLAGAIGMRAAGAAVGGLTGSVVGPKGTVAGAVAGSFLGPALFEMSQIVGPVARERAANQGREQPNGDDLGWAWATAGASGALNAIGARYLPNGDKLAGGLAKRISQSFLGEGIPEGGQAAVQQIGETFLTEQGLDLRPKEIAGEAIIGGGAGAAAVGVAEPFTKAKQAAETKVVAEQAAPIAPETAQVVSEQANQVINEAQVEETAETPEQRVTRLQEEATAAAGIELEEEGEVGVEPPVAITPPVAPTPEGAVAPVEPVVEPVVAEPQPAAEVAPERRDEEYTSSVEAGNTERAKQLVDEAFVAASTPETTDSVFERHKDYKMMGLTFEEIVQNPEALREEDQDDYNTVMYWVSQIQQGNTPTVVADDNGILWDGYHRLLASKIANAESVNVFKSTKEQTTDEATKAVVRDKDGNIIPLSQRFPPAAPAVTPPAEVAPEVAPPPNLEPLRRVARAEQTEEDVSGLVGQGLVELYNGQPVITQAGLEALPEAERPRLNPEARKIQIDTGSNEVVAEAIAKGLRIGVDQVGTGVRMPAGWTLVEDIYVPPKKMEKIDLSDVEALAEVDENSDIFAEIIRKKDEAKAAVVQKPEGSAFANQEEFRAAFDLRGEGHGRFATRLDLMVADGAITSEGQDLIMAVIFDNKTNDEFLANMEMGSLRPRVSRAYGRGGASRQTVETIRGKAIGYKPSLRMMQNARKGLQIDEQTAETLSTFWHEFGHAGYYSLLDKAQKSKIASVYNKTTQTQRKKFFESGVAAARQADFYSRYYAKSESEWFAQSFAEYVLTKKSEQKALVPIFESILNKVKNIFGKLFSRKEGTPELEDIFEYIIQGKDYGSTKIWWNGMQMSLSPAIYGVRGAQPVDPAFSRRLVEREKQNRAKAMGRTAPEVRESRREPTPLTQQDREYLDAVERGDLDAASRAVEQAAKKAGYTIKAYHGTDKKFTTFKSEVGDGFFFANRPVNNLPQIVSYLKLSNPLRINANGAQWTDIQYGDTKYDTGELAGIAMVSGYDGVIIENVIEGGETSPADVTIVFNPNQIKSAAPVTRDDQGNVIPLSQRFQPTEEDIRYKRIEMPRPAGMETEAVATKLESLGFGRGGIVSVVNEPDASFEGRTIIRDGKVVGIELNAAALKDDAAVERVLNHEIAESANADGALNTLVAGLTPKEKKEINDAITRLGYAEKARTAEEAARAVELLAEGWRGRRWFDRAVARVEAWANKLGYKLTRRAAEYIAARNMAEVNESFRKMSTADALANLRGARKVNFNGLSAVLIPPSEMEFAYSIAAYHGTPHEIKGRFQLAKIGTGEGATVYGWGLYFAENIDVALEYKNRLAKELRYAGSEFDNKNPSHVAADRLAMGKFYGKSREEVIQELENDVDYYADNENIQAQQWSQQIVQILRYNNEAKIERVGNLYSVDLDVSEDQLMDWDKPLSEQNPEVRKKLEPFLPPALQNPFEKKTIQELIDEDPTIQYVYRYLVMEEMKKTSFLDMFRALSKDEREFRAKQKVSEAFRSAGIIGIRYLDQGSRFAQPKKTGFGWLVDDYRGSNYFKTKEEAIKFAEEAQTRNYVIFDEDVISITGRNGQPVDIRESRREDAIPTFSEGSPEASTLSTMAASMAKVDAASEAKGPTTYKISEIASVWMDQGGDARQLQDMVVEYTNLTPANAKKVANAIAKQYGLQQQIAETGAVIAEPAPEVEGAPRKTSVQRLIEQAVRVRRPIVKLEVNEKTALKDQIRLKAREARETRKARKEAARDLAEAVTQYVKDNQIRGPVRARQTISLAKQALKLDVNNEKAVDRYIMYVERVVENANYDKDLSDAKALRKRAKEMAKKKNIGPEQKKVLEAIGNINPSLLDNPHEYNVLTERYLLGFLPVTSRRYSVMPDAEARQYLESLEVQMTRNQAELDRAELERFFEAQAGFAEQRGLSLDEAQNLLNEDGDIATIIQDYNLEKRKAAEEMLLNLAQNAQKTLKTYDDSANTARQKELISFMQKVKLESITSDEKKRFIRFANNILANGETFGVEQFEAVAKAQERLVEAAKDKRLAQKMNAWIGPLSGGSPAELVQKLSLITQSEVDTLKNIFGREAVGVFRRVLGLLDLDVAQTASTTAKEKVANKVGDFYKKLKKKYGEESVGRESNIFTTAAAYFIQAEGNKTQEESIAYRRRLWTENIEELRKSERREDREEAEIKQRALDSITGNSNAEILDSLRSINPAAYEQLMWWKDQMHPEYKPFLKDHVENFRNQANNYDNVDYLSIHYKWDQSPELPSDLEIQEFDDPVSFRIKQAANSVKRKDHPSLPVNPKTRVKANIDVNFGYNQYNALTEQIEKAYTAPAWEAVSAFVRDPLFEQVVGGKTNADFVKNILRNIKATRTRKAMLDDENQIIGGTVALTRRISTQATLGGFTQPLRQVPDQLFKLFATTGRWDLISRNIVDSLLNYSSVRNNPLLNKLPIGRRGDARAGSQFAAEFNELARKVEASVTNKQWTRYKELMTQMGEFWMTPLRGSDTWIAKVSWMSYYEAELNKRDIKMESWEREAELFEIDPARQEAAAQAEYLVDFYAGASDPTKMAALSKQGNNGWREFSKLIFLSLNSFALQQKSALMSDFRDLILRSGSRQAALAGITGAIGGMVAFHGMRIFIIGGLLYPAAMMVLKGIFGIDMDEPDEEEQEKQLKDNWRKMKASIYSNIVAGGAGQFLEGKSIDAFNRTMYLWDAHINPDEMMDDKGEFISFSKYEKEKSPFYRFRSYDKSEFTFGLADVLTEQAQRSVDQTAQLLSDEEMSVYTGNEQAYALFATGVEWAYFFRLMDTDLKRITTKLKNDIDKQAKEREAELRAIRNR